MNEGIGEFGLLRIVESLNLCEFFANSYNNTGEEVAGESYKSLMEKFEINS